jgi:hypothetical protein
VNADRRKSLADRARRLHASRDETTRTRDCDAIYDASDGRPYNPLTPQNDALPRIIITEVPVRDREGNLGVAYEVDWFNCAPEEAAILYERGERTVALLRERREGTAS